MGLPLQIGDWQEHPDASLTLPKDHDPASFWIYQNTRVNMGELIPVLDQAMQQVNAVQKARPAQPAL